MLSLSASSRIAAGTLLWKPSSFLPEPAGALCAADKAANSIAAQPIPASAYQRVRLRALFALCKPSANADLHNVQLYCRAKSRHATELWPATDRPRTKPVLDHINSVKAAAGKKLVRALAAWRDCRGIGQSGAPRY